MSEAFDRDLCGPSMTSGGLRASLSSMEDTRECRVIMLSVMMPKDMQFMAVAVSFAWHFH